MRYLFLVLSLPLFFFNRNLCEWPEMLAVLVFGSIYAFSKIYGLSFDGTQLFDTFIISMMVPKLMLKVHANFSGYKIV